MNSDKLSLNLDTFNNEILFVLLEFLFKINRLINIPEKPRKFFRFKESIR